MSEAIADKPKTKAQIKAEAKAQEKYQAEAEALAEVKAKAKRAEKALQSQVDKINALVAGLAVGDRLRLEDVPNEVYHRTKGIGSTLMKAAHSSTAAYKVKRDEPRKPTNQLQKIFDLGSAVHDGYILPKVFQAEYLLQPEDIPRRAGKKWDEFKALHSDKTILTREQLDESVAMVDALKASPQLKMLTEKSCGEVSYWYKDISGLVLKARSDMETDDLIIDLKTCRADTPERFANAVKYDYSVQEAHYRHVIGLPEMIYVGVGKAKPHDVFFTQQGDDVREKAEILLTESIKKIAHSEETGLYTGIPFEILTTHLYSSERI